MDTPLPINNPSLSACLVRNLEHAHDARCKTTAQVISRTCICKRQQQFYRRSQVILRACLQH